MTPHHVDRVLDWRYELRRLESDFQELPQAARDALHAAVGSFLQEDAMQLPAPGKREPPLRLDDAA